MTQHSTPILINGSGNSAIVTALALAAAGLPVVLAPPAAPFQPQDDWQSVLALSPSSRLMLESLGVWQRLDKPTAPVHDMQVYGADKASIGAAELAFAPSPNLGADRDADTDNADTNETVKQAESLADIVSLAALSRALQATLEAALADNELALCADRLVDAELPQAAGQPGQAQLADGTVMPFSLLVDTQRSAPPWRARRAAQPLAHDYHAAALVGRLQSSLPHGQMAQQIFLPTGPLALLPLPDTHQMALVWSLPQARADALARVPAAILSHELQAATQDRFGQLQPVGPLAQQALHLQLAENFVEDGVVLLGEAAHVVHPLAGQGFNLTLRDAAQLADTLYDTQQIGLPFGDATMLGTYASCRRRAASDMATATHGLNGLFKTLPMLGGFGLTAMAALQERQPKLRRLVQAAADGRQGDAAEPAPRLLRGRSFTA
ncbi:MAG: FAD-dependent monooxygenase [Parvibaculales bacterium]